MSHLLPLHRVLCWTPEAHANPLRPPVSPLLPEAPLCLDGGRYLSRREFAVACGKVCDWLVGPRSGTGVEQPPATRVLISLDDPFDFLCAVFGTLAAGCWPVLPAHDAPAYWAALAATNAYDRTLIAEDFAQIALQAPPDKREGAASIDLPNRPIDPRAVLTVFTSGSTGTPKAIHKTLAQLDAEVQGFAAQWSDTFDQAVFQASVPHHHIYGLTFFLLWPLAAGGIFDRVRCTGPGDWSEMLSARRLIISTPPQLARWPGLSGFDTPLAMHSGIAFLSAGAPLSHDTARDYLRVFGAAPFEVYGSTETGAIATRQQRADHAGEQWSPLPGQIVRRSEAGTLAVQSPHLRAGLDAQWARDGFVTADAVTLCDADAEGEGATSFLLGGRIDRVAKVSGKRVSLPEIEMALAGHPSVYQAAVVTLTTVTPHASGQRDARAQGQGGMASASTDEAIGPIRERERIGAVIVLRETGSATLFDRGRAAVIRQLRRHVASRVDAAAVPHYWRFVAALSYDARGKLPAAQLRAAFAPTPTLPEVLSYAQSTASDALPRWRYALRISASLVQFEGHFPIQPILPGVAQLDWAVRFAQRHVALLTRMRSVEQLKFTAPVMPGDTLMLTLTHDVARNRVGFAFERDGRACATGLLCYPADTLNDGARGVAAAGVPVGAVDERAVREHIAVSVSPEVGEQ